MATNAKIETGDPALAIALCWFAVFYSAFMVGYWLWVEYFGIQRKVFTLLICQYYRFPATGKLSESISLF